MCAAIILGISRDNILGYITVTAKDIEDWCVQPKDNVGTKPHLTPNTILFKRFNRAFEKSLHAVFSQFFLCLQQQPQHSYNKWTLLSFPGPCIHSPHFVRS